MLACCHGRRVFDRRIRPAFPVEVEYAPAEFALTAIRHNRSRQRCYSPSHKAGENGRQPLAAPPRSQAQGGIRRLGDLQCRSEATIAQEGPTAGQFILHAGPEIAALLRTKELLTFAMSDGWRCWALYFGRIRHFELRAPAQRIIEQMQALPESRCAQALECNNLGCARLPAKYAQVHETSLYLGRQFNFLPTRAGRRRSSLKEISYNPCRGLSIGPENEGTARSSRLVDEHTPSFVHHSGYGQVYEK